MSKKNHNINVTINLSGFESELRQLIACDFRTLELISKQIVRNHRANNEFNIKQGITNVIFHFPDKEIQIQREINKCFKSILGSVQDYLDKMLAILKLKNESLALISVSSQDELNTLVNNKFSECVHNISIDRSLNVPKKINILLDDSDAIEYKETLQSYFDLRNGLEHHKGVAKTDRIVKFKRMALITSGGIEIKKLPFIGKEDEGVFVKAIDEKIEFDKGGNLLLSESDVKNIIISLVIHVIPMIQNSVSEKMK